MKIRLKAEVERPLWAQQRHHVPQRSLAEALVLVVLARSPSRSPLAQSTGQHPRVTETKIRNTLYIDTWTSES